MPAPHEIALDRMQKQVERLHGQIRTEEEIPKNVRGLLGSSLGLIKGFFKSVRGAFSDHVEKQVEKARQEEKEKFQKAIRGIHEAYGTEIETIKQNLRSEHQSVLVSKNTAIETAQQKLQDELDRSGQLRQELTGQQNYSERLQNAMQAQQVRHAETLQARDTQIRGKTEIAQQRFDELNSEKIKRQEAERNLHQEQKAHERTKDEHGQTQTQLTGANGRVGQLEEQIRQGPNMETHAATLLKENYGVERIDNLRVPFGNKMVKATSAQDVWAAIHTRKITGQKTGFLDVFSLPNGQDKEVLAALAHNGGHSPILKIGGEVIHVDDLTPAVAKKVRGLLMDELKTGKKLDAATVYDRDIHPDEVHIKPAYKRWGTWLAAGAAVAAVMSGASLFKNFVSKSQAPKTPPEVIRSITDIKDSELFTEAQKAIKPSRPDAGVDDVAITATLMRHELENLQQAIQKDRSRSRIVDLKQLALDIHGRMASVREKAVENGQISYTSAPGKSGPQAMTTDTLRKIIYPGMQLPREKWQKMDATYQRHMRPTWSVFKGFGRVKR